jgi:uncharacterized damage-inducible protein DinB
MSIAELLQEVDREWATTRRVLARVPSDRLDWTPHAKSMSIGRLAMHLAVAPAFISGWALADTFEFTSGPPEVPTSTEDILLAHDEGLTRVKQNLVTIGDSDLKTVWSGVAGGKVLMTMPKGTLLRSVLMNHVYHHRGQLTVYLRLLDIAVPAVYGPSADEQAFG